MGAVECSTKSILREYYSLEVGGYQSESSYNMEYVRTKIKSYLGLPQTLTDLDGDIIRSRLKSLMNSMMSMFQKGKEALSQSQYNPPTQAPNHYHQPSPAPNHYQAPSPAASHYQAPSQSYHSPGDESATDKPVPLAVPTLLPITKSAELSPGFQLLVQYVAAIVGFAFILAI